MIRLGLRLTVGGGREAIVRLALIAVAVAIGVGLLLVTVAGTHAVNAQNGRYAWLETGFTQDSRVSSTASVSPGTDPVWWSLRRDSFHGDEIGRIDVAATGPNPPVPPGLDALPGPGEFVASPALSTLLRSTPPGELGDRYPGAQVGTIGAAGLPAPDTLLIVIGHDVADVADLPNASLVDRISATSPADCRGDCGIGFGIDSRGMALVLGVVAVALIVPVLIFIGSATRLSAARREQRFAAMRLVGATPRQVAVLSAVESSAAAAVGTAAGLALFLAARPKLATIPFTGAPFFPGDLSLTGVDVLVVALGVPVAAAIAARVALRRVQVSPLGVSRRATPPPPRAWRLVPLLAGLGELGWFAIAGRPATTDGQLAAYLPGITLVTVGLATAGPWLTMTGARLLAHRSRRPAALIAGRRLADDPRAGFRAISGLVLALFVGSGAIGTIRTVVDAAQPSGSDGSLLVEELFDPVPTATIAPTTVDALRAVPGVTGVAVIRTEPEVRTGPGLREQLASCAELATTPELGRCPAGATVVTVGLTFAGSVIDGAPDHADVVWPAATVSPDQLAALPVVQVVVANDGTHAAVEQARTILEQAYPSWPGAETVSEINDHGTRDLAQYQQLADVVIGASLAIAGCSLAVGVAGGLSERRRPFSLLRLTGVPLGVLRRVVALETVLPLVATALVATASGFLTAQLFLRAQMDRSVHAPGGGYFLVVVTGLVASLAVLASTLPLLDRITGPEAARND